MASRCVFLFGAGASFGSQATDRPPLGINGFWTAIREHLESKAEHLNIANPSIHRLHAQIMIQEMMNSNPEEGMDYITAGTGNRALFQWLLADFFYKFAPNVDSIYLRLFNELRARGMLEHTSLVTTNYDLLIERSLRLARIPFSYSLKADSGVPLLKPHGSCNFSVTSDRVRLGAGAVFIGFRHELAGNLVLLSQDQVEESFWRSTPRFGPAMALYNPQKARDTTCVEIENAIRLLPSIFASADRIIIIGLGFYAHDSHIWNSILSSASSMLYVGDKNSAQALASLRLPRKSLHATGYFAEAMEEIIDFCVS